MPRKKTSTTKPPPVRRDLREKRVPVSFALPESMVVTIRKVALQQDDSMSAIVTRILREAL